MGIVTPLPSAGKWQMIALSNVFDSISDFGKAMSRRISPRESSPSMTVPIAEAFSFGDENFRITGPIDRNNPVVQYFRSPDDYLSGVSLRFGTYLVNWPHRLILSIHAVDENDNIRSQASNTLGELLFQIDVAAAGVSNVGYFNFYFSTIPDSKGRLFAITIASAEAKDGEALTAWLSRTDQRIPGHVLCRAARVSIEDEFGLQAKLITSNPSTSAYPSGILYSPLSSCNMNCVHCVSRHSRKRVVRMAEDIRKELKARVDAKDLQWVFTDYSGDIFHAERKNPGELDFLFGLGIAIHVDTNGAYLDNAAIERVMRSPVGHLSISVDAALDETYRVIRVGAPPIDQIFASAKALVDARRKHGREGNFKIYMGFTLMRSNIHELPLFIQKAAAAGIDAIGCRHLEVYHSEMEEESLLSHKRLFNSIRAESIELAKSLNITLYIGEELDDLPAAGATPPCLIPWGSAVILANGDVMACCVPGSKMGNVGEQPLEVIWQGEAYRRLRRRVNSADAPSLCTNCQFRNTLNSFEDVAALRSHQLARPLLDDLMGP
jgi:radical SAM protein with 4Fe4S-binding SPASM domain